MSLSSGFISLQTSAELTANCFTKITSLKICDIEIVFYEMFLSWNILKNIFENSNRYSKHFTRISHIFLYVLIFILYIKSFTTRMYLDIT